MQIVKHTPSELTLKNQSSHLSKGFISLWALLFSGIPLVMMGVWLYGLGITQLSCQRLESTQVRCHNTQSRMLGLIPGATATVNQATAAEMKTETSVEGDATHNVDHWVVLQTPNGEVTYVEDPLRINGRKGSADEMQAITNQLNSFFSSDQATVTIQRDMRFRLGNSIFPLGFMGLFVLIGSTVVYFTFRSEELVFDKISQRFWCKHKTLLGTQTWQCPLQEIQDVMVDIQTDRDGDSTYVLKLLPEAGKQALIPGCKEQVETALNVIREFLTLNSAPVFIAVTTEPDADPSHLDVA
ncbi:MAG: hypothetical protein KTR27_15060 [Leptolyngbyaceae cyanobacterium MAG.088]|nr:hypothetical protein [Leptolyngbyaceae cyanobacterium MAG.088]